MPRMSPLPLDATPELRPDFDFFLGTLGFTPNSVLTMQRKPRLVRALAGLNAAVMAPEGEVDLGFRRLIGHVASKAAGCLYCQAHTLLGAKNFGVSDAKLADVWNYSNSPHYSEPERLALDFALAAAAQPNAVTDRQFQALRVFVDRCIELAVDKQLDATTAAMAKMLASELQCRTADECLQFYGGNGYMMEYQIAHSYLDARIRRIAGGSSEVMREMISRKLFA